MAPNSKLPKVSGALVGGAVVGGSLAMPAIKKTQGYADLSTILGNKKRAAFADLRPATSALVRAKTGALAPVKAEGQKLKSVISQAEAAAKQSAVATQLKQNKAALKGQLGSAEAAVKRDAAIRAAPLKSALVQSPALKEARAGKAQLNQLAGQARNVLQGDMANAKSVASQAANAAKKSGVGQEASKLKGGAGEDIAKIKQAMMNDRAAALKGLTPVKSALVADKSRLDQFLAPGRSTLAKELAAAKQAAGQARTGVSKEAGNVGQQAVGQLKKRPKIWNIVKPAGSP